MAEDTPDGVDPPDQVERDPAALSSAEDLDEDRVGTDTHDPPEGWAGADRYGTTPFEQRQGEDLDSKLAAERRDDVP
jgi:hypothetical protein